MAKYNTRYYIYLFFALCALIAFSFFWKYKEGFDDNKINYLDGVDVIYWINLDRSKDRRQKMEKMFHDDVFKGIPNQRIVAYDGKNDPDKVFNKLVFNNKKQSNAEYACLLSHLETIRTFNESKNNIALIFEDDVTLEFRKYWRKSIKEIMKNAPTDWDIILLSYIYYNDMSPRILFYSWDASDIEYDIAIGNYYSSLSYVINKKGSAKLINKIYDKNTNKYNPDKHSTLVSDVYLEQNANVYAYKYPMFIYKTINDSTIHDNHQILHRASKKIIVNNYDKLNVNTH
jgi:GR25 family glycosyltransferase involved in LPS biosynthesis